MENQIVSRIENVIINDEASLVEIVLIEEEVNTKEWLRIVAKTLLPYEEDNGKNNSINSDI